MGKRILCIGGSEHAIPVEHALGKVGLRSTYYSGGPNSGENQDAYANDVDLEEIGIAVLTGGEDVGPNIYGHTADITTKWSKSRDQFESRLASRLIAANIPIFGICRGAQFLCAMAGGKLIQDVTGHTETHRLRYINKDGKEAAGDNVTSTHHQMQFPWTIPDNNFKILAVSYEPRSEHYGFDGRRIKAMAASDEFTIEPEVVYYPGINGLAVQYHPETMRSDSWGFTYCVDLIKQYLKPLYLERCEDN